MRKIKSFKDIKLSEKKDFGLNDQNIVDINNINERLEQLKAFNTKK